MTKLMFNSSNLYEMAMNSNFVQKFIDERCMLEDTEELWRYFAGFPQVGNAIARNYMMLNSQRMSRVVELLAKPRLTLVGAGVKGGGKTVFSYWAGERIHAKTGMRVCLLNPLDFKEELLPKYFYEAFDVDEIEENSFVIADEAQIFWSSRRAVTKENVDFSSFLTVQRHTGNPMLVMQQVMAMTDLNAFRMADNFLFKSIGLLQMMRDRTRRDPFAMFLDFLRPLGTNETLFITADMSEIYFFNNPLPSFWDEKLSTPARRLTFEEAIKFAKKLHEHGADIEQIEQRVKLKGAKLNKKDIEYYVLEKR